MKDYRSLPITNAEYQILLKSMRSLVRGYKKRTEDIKQVSQTSQSLIDDYIMDGLRAESLLNRLEKGYNSLLSDRLTPNPNE